MNKFTILVDAGADLPAAYLKENNIHLVPMYFTLDGVTFIDGGEKGLPVADFYKRLRGGAIPATSMVNVETFVEHFKEVLDTGDDLLALPFSSGISGTANSARLAAEEVRPLYPNQKIVVVDALTASLGCGLSTHSAIRMRDEGKSIEEIARWLEDNRLYIQHLVAVDDLTCLQRGGRISKSTAIIGGLIGIKPLIEVSKEGTLRPAGKKRGRRAVLDELVDWMGRLTTIKEHEVIAISHGDCEEDASYVISRIKERYKVKNVIMNHIGPLIGSHAGPGTVALFFFGNERT